MKTINFTMNANVDDFCANDCKYFTPIPVYGRKNEYKCMNQEQCRYIVRQVEKVRSECGIDRFDFKDKTCCCNEYQSDLLSKFFKNLFEKPEG